MRSLSRGLAELQASASAMRWKRYAGALGVMLVLLGISVSLAVGASSVPVLWTAGGLSAGTDSAGQAARIAADASGNVAVVSGPSWRVIWPSRRIRRLGPSLAEHGQPRVGTFAGDWVVAAPNGDFVAVGHNVDSRGRPIASTMVRYASDGTLLWRVDFSAGFFPAVARLAGRRRGQRLSGLQLGRVTARNSAAEVQPFRCLALVAGGSRPAAG